MQFAVFLRGANVGGRTFSTKAVAEALADLEVKNLGTAGTYRVGKARSATAVRDAFQPLVPEGCDLLVRPLDEVLALVKRDPFAREGDRGSPFVTVLAEEPKRPVAYPWEVPDGGPWQLRVLRAEGPYVLSLRDAAEPGKFYPNEVIERALGVRATTRGWKTMLDLAKLAKPPA
ncbi:MAG TPA: hypothetical protein VNZ52_10550 [Candidatus Thermoplasmatota archaeon]|nr:hypothetical protein [Candidatus Thermoplasmatota archaeon]